MTITIEDFFKNITNYAPEITFGEIETIQFDFENSTLLNPEDTLILINRHATYTFGTLNDTYRVCKESYNDLDFEEADADKEDFETFKENVETLGVLIDNAEILKDVLHLIKEQMPQEKALGLHKRYLAQTRKGQYVLRTLPKKSFRENHKSTIGLLESAVKKYEPFFS